jgi:hypothetical protein
MITRKLEEYESSSKLKTEDLEISEMTPSEKSSREDQSARKAKVVNRGKPRGQDCLNL